ncbi:MAG: glycosyltransferase family 2 protein [Nitrospinaceae bacterium]|nr:MAG: glycosyltransferase family 2 protein [Nitrospinaceae bacterium]
MATLPYFFIGPSALLSVFGLVRGPDPTMPTPAEDWQEATVDVVIPAFNEERGIVPCLESLAAQTMKPHRIVLIDDGSTDQTAEYAQAFSDQNGLNLEIVRRKAPIGKTPTLKREARELDGDVEFILDGDTVLGSNNYIARTVEELYKGVGIASACGTVLPLREKDERALMPAPRIQKFLEQFPDAAVGRRRSGLHRLARAVTNLYRDVLYFFLQQFIYHGQMVFFGTIINPVGCAVAYRRKYLKDVFDRFEPKLGDDLTTSEDIFIGFALLEKGYRNIQLRDVFAHSEEPEAQRVPRQVFLWSSSFLQSCYYFPSLVFSAFKSIKRSSVFKNLKTPPEPDERRKIKEAYRQPFGVEYTHKFGRPIGWIILLSAIEKVTFPLAILLMAAFGWWDMLLLTMVAETSIQLVLALGFATDRHLEYVVKSLLVTPLRYLCMLFDLFTITRFLVDVLILKNRKWRK